MRTDFLERTSRLDSPVHRLPAGLKLGFALGLVLTLVLLPRGAWLACGAVAAALFALVLVARVPIAALLKRLLWLEPLVLGVALLALAQPDGARLFGWIVLRSTLCLATMLLLGATTPFDALLGVLARLRVPALLVTTLALLQRYLSVLVDEGQRMRRARASRSFGRSRWREWQSLGTTLGVLFVRSSERAERIWTAMCARGWR